MITKEDIVKFGWKLTSAMSNGGTTGFTRKSLKPNKSGKIPIFNLEFNGSNTWYRKQNDPKLNEITLSKIDYNPTGIKGGSLADRGLTEEVLFKGIITDIEELKEKLLSFNEIYETYLEFKRDDILTNILKK